VIVFHTKEGRMEKDRRRSDRFTIHQMIELSMSRETFFMAEGKNISEHGILCVSDEYIEPYKKVFLMLSFPEGTDNYILQSDGIVIRCDKTDDGYAVGINFTDIDPTDKERLREYIQSVGE
jgi:c-di-GMP-binding flagellar brake protein YcgR